VTSNGSRFRTAVRKLLVRHLANSFRQRRQDAGGWAGRSPISIHYRPVSNHWNRSAEDGQHRRFHSICWSWTSQEHAYLLDYKPSDRPKYIQRRSLAKRRWDVIDKRIEAVHVTTSAR